MQGAAPQEARRLSRRCNAAGAEKAANHCGHATLPADRSVKTLERAFARPARLSSRSFGIASPPRQKNRIQALVIFHFRIEQRVEDVGDQIKQHDQRCVDDQRPHHERVVAIDRAIDKV